MRQRRREESRDAVEKVDGGTSTSEADRGLRERVLRGDGAGGTARSEPADGVHVAGASGGGSVGGMHEPEPSPAALAERDAC